MPSWTETVASAGTPATRTGAVCHCASSPIAETVTSRGPSARLRTWTRTTASCPAGA